ncbi:MAG: ABC transporter substrate-binding protein [Candidatus Latescibacterota bacterium]|nr:MAG: ABC transporter substrate-binding protein [Candidatus Latescibacterota bacterium]
MTKKQSAVIIKDDLGDTLELDRVPSRIVSLIPSITETLFELGAGSRVAGITDYCIHPADALAGIPKVGGTKGFSIDLVRDLSPDLAIANKEENRKPEIDALRQVCPVFVSYPRTVEQAVKTILDLGTLTGRSAEASTMAAECGSLLESIYPPVLGRPFRTVCFVWREPWIAVGRDTYVDDLFDTFGFKNVFAADDGRYPQTSLEAVLDRGPEIVILPDEPYAFGPSDHTEVESFFAGRGSPVRVLRMDGTLITWFGYRTMLGIDHLRQVKTRLLAQ